MMLTAALKQLKVAVLLLGIFSVLTGLIYPAVVTVVAQLFFPWQANGSLMQHNGKTIGSLLIGQEINDPRYFSGRPSATTPFPYNAANSSGSNLGPSNPDFIKIVTKRRDIIHKANPDIHIEIPIDLVTASASGLDPDLNLRAALYQVPRISKLRNIPRDKLIDMINSHSKGTSLRLFGIETVNILELNLALDQLR